MNHKLAMRRLYWKEVRQLAPLVALLIAMGLILHLVYLVSTRDITQWTPPWLIYLGLPGIFAVGTGALLIGQEKEMRTIGWLSSLPIAPRDILRVKLFAAMTGLVVVWFFSLLFPVITGAWREFEFEWLWPVHSVFVLLLGVATAWYFKSSLISLLVVIPLACMPLIAGETVKLLSAAWAEDAQRFRWDLSSETWLNISFSILFGCVAGWAGWRLGERFFAPAPAPLVSPKSREREQQSAQQLARLRTRWSPFSALVWQATTQSRIELSIAAVLVLVVSLTILIPMDEGLHVLISTLAAFVGSALLGVSVFQGDAIHNRVRFLADRGIGPSQVWRSRHMVPASLLALSVLLIAGLLINYQTPDQARGLQAALPLVFLLVALVLGVYATSQWVAQLTRSPIVAMVAAFLLSLIVIAYFAFVIQDLESPWWLVLPALLTPFVATYAMTRRWMDRSLGLRFWLTHASLLVFAITLPAAPLLIALAQSSGMSSAMRAQFKRDAGHYLAHSYRAYQMEPRELQVTKSTDLALFVSNLKTQLETYSGPVRFDQNLLLLLSNAELDRLRLSQLDTSGDVDSNAADANAVVDNSADSGLVAKKEELRGRLRTEVGLLHELVTRLRLSPRLREQDAADQVELWMQFLVHQERAEETLSAELVAKLKQQLDNVALRDESIRRAIVLSWDESVRSIRRNGSFVDFGGYSLPVASKRLSIADVVRMRGFASQQAELLWKYFHAEASDEQARLRAELAQAWYRPLTEFTSETQSLETAAEYERPLMSSMFNGRLPGRAWHKLRSN